MHPPHNITGESVPQMKEALLISTFDLDSSNKLVEEKLDINGAHRVNTLFSGMSAHYNIYIYIYIYKCIIVIVMLNRNVSCDSGWCNAPKKQSRCE